MLLGRYFLATFSAGPITSDFGDWANLTAPAGSCRTQEWLRGEQLCTYKGKYHLAWSVPVYDPTYWSPSAAIHSFLMFAPFFVMKRNMIIQGIFLWGAGPYAASWITSNLQEQASIWCFFSIAQIGIMLFIIREQLLLNWGRGNVTTSIHQTHEEKNGAKASNGSNGSNGSSNGKGHHDVAADANAQASKSKKKN